LADIEAAYNLVQAFVKMIIPAFLASITNSGRGRSETTASRREWRLRGVPKCDLFGLPRFYLLKAGSGRSGFQKTLKRLCLLL
jgi:hypothetical protein